ncbi:MAG TPA: hypothetical protein V6C82_08500 [Chroococcales cyanobacterium]|jgi:phosphohistidine swiveling domain-containing protein
MGFEIGGKKIATNSINKMSSKSFAQSLLPSEALLNKPVDLVETAKQATVDDGYNNIVVKVAKDVYNVQVGKQVDVSKIKNGSVATIDGKQGVVVYIDNESRTKRLSILNDQFKSAVMACSVGDYASTVNIFEHALSISKNREEVKLIQDQLGTMLDQRHVAVLPAEFGRPLLYKITEKASILAEQEAKSNEVESLLDSLKTSEFTDEIACAAAAGLSEIILNQIPAVKDLDQKLQQDFEGTINTYVKNETAKKAMLALGKNLGDKVASNVISAGVGAVTGTTIRVIKDDDLRALSQTDKLAFGKEILKDAGKDFLIGLATAWVTGNVSDLIQSKIGGNEGASPQN